MLFCVLTLLSRARGACVSQSSRQTFRTPRCKHLAVARSPRNRAVYKHCRVQAVLFVHLAARCVLVDVGRGSCWRAVTCVL